MPCIVTKGYMELSDTAIPNTHAATHNQDLLRFLNTDKKIAMTRLMSAGTRTTTPAKLIIENRTNNTVRTHKIVSKRDLSKIITMLSMYILLYIPPITKINELLGI